MLHESYTFSYRHQDGHSVEVSGPGIRIDAVVALFGEFLAGCGFHPDNIKAQLVQEDTATVSIDEYIALDRMKQYIAFSGKPKERAALLKEIKELLAQ